MCPALLDMLIHTVWGGGWRMTAVARLKLRETSLAEVR